MSRIVNLRTTTESFVYIGRGSIWGNPFVIGKDGSRDAVIAAYERWIRTQPTLLAQLPALKGATLGCYCAPLRCHGEVLLKLLKEQGIEI